MKLTSWNFVSSEILSGGNRGRTLETSQVGIGTALEVQRKIVSCFLQIEIKNYIVTTSDMRKAI